MKCTPLRWPLKPGLVWVDQFGSWTVSPAVLSHPEFRVVELSVQALDTRPATVSDRGVRDDLLPSDSPGDVNVSAPHSYSHPLQRRSLPHSYSHPLQRRSLKPKPGLTGAPAEDARANR